MAISPQEQAQINSLLAQQKARTTSAPKASSGGISPQEQAQINQLLASQKRASQPVQEKQGGFEKFANTISAPFRAVSNTFIKPVVETLAKPIGEVAASVNELQGKQAPKWTEDTRLASPEIRAYQKYGVSPAAAMESERLKQQGAKGAGFTDVLNVASLAPTGAFAKGAGTAIKAAEGATKTTGVLSKLSKFGKTAAEVAPSAAGWGGAYGAAQNLDTGSQGKGLVKDTLKGAAVGAATGVGLAGAGSVVGAGMQKGSQLLNKDLRTQAISNKNFKALSEIENSNAPLRKIVEKYKQKGIDIKRKLADTDYLVGSVDSDGTIRTIGEGNAISKLQEFIKPQEDVIYANLKREGKAISLDELRQQMMANIENSGIKGADKLAAFRKIESEIEGLRLEADQTGNIPLFAVHDAKRYKYANIDYMNPSAKNTDKIIARTLKEAVENNTDSINVKQLNNELSEDYALQAFLERLDGKKVKGGRLGKYFAQVIGATVGSHIGGPIGTVAGADIGGRLQGAMMKRTFNKPTGKELKMSEAMQGAIKSGKLPKTPPALIPENRRLGYSIKTQTPDTSGMLSQTEAKKQLKLRGWQNVGDQSSDNLLIKSGKQKTTQSAAKSEAKKPISETLAQLVTKDDFDAEIAKRIEEFRNEAGLKAERAGAGVTRRNVEDAAGNFQFQANNFSLNKAKGNMASQANNYKKEAMRLLYDNDPDFRAIVDKKDELFAQRVEIAKDDAEFLDLINEVDKEIKTFDYAKPYKQSGVQPQTPTAPAPIKAETSIKAPEPKMKDVIEGLRAKKPVRTNKENLYVEARKYKTAEEFINAQTKKSYRSAHQIDFSKSSAVSGLQKLDEFIAAQRLRDGYPSIKEREVKRLRSLIGDPYKEVKIYRASPKNELNPGDWVTVDKTYAGDIKRQNGGKVYEYTVKAGDLYYPNDVDGFMDLPSLARFSSFQFVPKEDSSRLTEIFNRAKKSTSI